MALKHSISVGQGVSGERPHPKERRAEGGRSCEHRRPISPEHPRPPSLLFTPMAPSHPTTGSNKRHLPLERCGDTDAPVSSVGLVAPFSSLQPVHSSGYVGNIQVSSGLVTSGLTTAQSEEIFLLSCEVQTLRGKLALDFIGLSHQETSMGAWPPATKRVCKSGQMAPRTNAEQPLSTRVKSPSRKPILFSFITL